MVIYEETYEQTGRNFQAMKRGRGKKEEKERN